VSKEQNIEILLISKDETIIGYRYMGCGTDLIGIHGVKFLTIIMKLGTALTDELQFIS